MERITCLQAIFSRKNKVKLVAGDGVGESSEKVTRFEERAFHEEPSTTYVEMRTDHSSGPHELITAPLMEDWGKKGAAPLWPDIEELEATEAMKGCTADVLEFKDFNFPNSLIVEEHRLGTLPQCALHVDVGAEVAYEGGDEDEDSAAGASDVKECESDQSFLEGANEIVAEDTAPGHILVNDSARYYQTQSNGATKCNGGDERHFSEGEVCLEVGNEYVSDPGVYNCKDSEMACSPYFDPGTKLGHQSENLPVVEMQGKSVLSECGSQHVTSSMTGHQVMRASCGSGSFAEVHNMNMSDVVFKAVPMSTSHSESALQDAKDRILNLNFSKEGKHRKPWWKGFLFTHRNIHRRVPGLLSGVASNGPMGYGSEVDYCNGRPCPLFLPDHSLKYKTSVGDGNAIGKDIKKNMEECAVDMSMNNFDSSAPPVAASSLTAVTVIDTVGDRKLYIPHKPDLSHVEEWVNSIDFAAVDVDEDIENDEQGLREPCSPAPPALTFFSTRVQSAPQLNIDGDGLIAHHSDGLLGGDAEMAALVAQSVNPLSTVAYFSGVGLRIIPPLALYNSLKTLNLSANHIVRLTPGSLPRSLHSLDLSHNKIVVIEGLRELTRLRVLNLSHNRISRIGHGLAGCSSLRELYLAGNKISEIEGLHRLLKLSLLDLSFNKLTTTKAISQLAANYNSLQALNLLGNALNSNLGEEPLRKLVTGLAPHILYLNKQAVKAVYARDVAVDSVARAALGTPSHHHPARGSKVPKGGSSMVPVASTSQGKIRNGEKGAHSLNIVPGGYSRNTLTKEAIHKQQEYHHSHHHHQRRHSGNKEHALQSPGIWLQTPAVESRPVEVSPDWMVLAPRNGMNRTRSDGSIYEYGLQPVDSPFA